MREALTLLVVVVVAAFALGSAANVRRGNAALRWLQGGLPQIGEKTTVRWIGTTSVDLGIARAKDPFAEAAIVLFLEPRDLPWLWATSRARGRRDTLIVRARLRKAPREELEAVDRTSWSGRDAARRIAGERWTVREAGGLATHAKRDAGLAAADELLALARGAEVTVRRLSLRREEPHLTLHVDLPDRQDPAAFFAALREIGTRASA